MILVPPVSRAEIDAWPIAKAGLSRRATNALTRGKVRTIEELRRLHDGQLLKLRGVGLGVLEETKHLLVECERLEMGKVQSENLETFLREILSPTLRAIIELRFGLQEREGKPRAPLCEVGIALHLTMERVRQLQVAATQRLAGVVSKSVLRVAGQTLAKRILQRSGVVTVTEARGWSDPICGAYSMTGILWFLNRFTEQIAFRYGCFVVASERELVDVEDQLFKTLRTADAPMTAETILTRMTSASPTLVRALLRHHPAIAETQSGEFFLVSRVAPLLVEQILNANKGPLHYRLIAERYHALLVPRCVRKPRQILRSLRASTQCERLGHGFYRLRFGV